MAKKKPSRPKKANAQKPRRRPGGRGSGPVVDAGHAGGHWHDDGTWHGDGLAPADAFVVEEELETDQERAQRLALVAEVEAIPVDRAAAALLRNPLVQHLGAVLLSGADADADPVVAAPAEPLDDDAVARLARWSRGGLLLDDRAEADDLAADWREGGVARAGVARAVLAQYLGAVVAADQRPEDGATGWLGPAAADGGQPGHRGRTALADAVRAEVVIDLVGHLALVGAVELGVPAHDGSVGDLLRRDVHLLAAAGLLVVEGDVATVDPDLRGVLLSVADELVGHLGDGDG